jgi:hypothetical protein
MTKTEISRKISNDPIVNYISSIIGNGKSSTYLVGGAVIDIMENRKPKDYDIIDKNIKKSIPILIDHGWKFLYSTSMTTTLIEPENNIIVQFLKTNVTEFEFIISQIAYNFGEEKVCNFCEVSFKSKILIPTEASFKSQKGALNALKRIPHWRKKGYTIPNETYFSLLSIVSSSITDEPYGNVILKQETKVEIF